MAEIILAETSSVVNPAVGFVSIYADNTANPQIRQRDDNGKDVGLLGLSNSSTVSQLVNNTTRTYIAGSAMPIPVNKMQVGSAFRWKFNMTKTAAGVAASTFDVCVGINGTTADPARLTFTKPAGTAAADEAFVTVDVVVRSVSAAGVMVGEFVLLHNLAATGHAVIPCVVVNSVSAGFDMTVNNLIIGMCVTAGAADNLTFQLVQAEGRGI